MNRKFLILITGLLGTSKNTLANYLTKELNKISIKTNHLYGESIRSFFNFRGHHSKSQRKSLAIFYLNLCKELILRSDNNIVLSRVALFSEFHKLNKKNFKNFFQIVIKSKTSKVKKLRKNIFNKKKNRWYIDIKPIYPDKPNLILRNNYKKDVKILVKQILDKKLKSFFNKVYSYI